MAWRRSYAEFLRLAAEDARWAEQAKERERKRLEEHKPWTVRAEERLEDERELPQDPTGVDCAERYEGVDE